MTNENNGIGIGALLKETYSELCRRQKAEEIAFKQKVLAEIADDSDWHRSRTGYMGYESAALLRFSNKVWLIGRGEACGGYPADPFNSDILALELIVERKNPEQINDAARNAIQESTYFRNTLVYGMCDGNLCINPKGAFKEWLLDIVGPEAGSFVAQMPKYNRELILASTLSPVCEKPLLYKPEFAVFLADSIEAVLSQKDG